MFFSWKPKNQTNLANIWENNRKETLYAQNIKSFLIFSLIHQFEDDENFRDGKKNSRCERRIWYGEEGICGWRRKQSIKSMFRWIFHMEASAPPNSIVCRDFVVFCMGIGEERVGVYWGKVVKVISRSSFMIHDSPTHFPAYLSIFGSDPHLSHIIHILPSLLSQTKWGNLSINYWDHIVWANTHFPSTPHSLYMLQRWSEKSKSWWEEFW